MAHFYLGRLVKERFYRAMGENNVLDEVHPRDLEKINDDKWLQLILDHHDRNLDIAVTSLIKYCLARKQLDVHNKKYNNKQDKKFSKAIMPVGKDREGLKVLFFDLAKISNSKLEGMEIRDHLIYWMERLHRQKENEKISLLLHHGAEKNMEECLPLMLMVYDLTSVYPGFVKSYYIIEDLLSRNCRRNLNNIFGDLLNLIKESTMFQQITLDEKFEISGSSLKIRVPMKTKKDDEETKSTDGEVSQPCDDIKSVSTVEDIQEKDVDDDQKKLKKILAELHNVENVIFKLIRNVQDLISKIPHEDLHQK